jgi:hypothetical protein
LIICICSALRAAMAVGLIEHNSGYLLLSSSGRKKLGKAFGL